MSKRRLFALACLLAVAGVARADGEKLAVLKAGAETYTDVTVTSVTATDLYFSHSRGLGNAKLKSLAPELQSRFHFDPVKAAEKENQQAEARALYAQAVERAKLAAPPKPATAQGESLEPGGLPDGIGPHEIAAKSFLNQRAPPIIAEKWLTQPPNLSGKFVLLDFWATCSVPCRQSIPMLNAFYNTFKDRLVVIGISDETEAEVRKMTEPRIDYFVAVDPKHRASSTFGVQRIPHAVLLDPKGIVRFEGHPGYLDEGKLEKLLTQYSD
jgi:thiol-disulfide isomerase/thioredoxin